jgi:hypothetical protein
VTLPATGVVPGPVTVKVAALIVAAFMASLNVAEIAVLTGTPTAPSTGTVEITVGAPVLKLQTKLAASAMPNTSFAPVVIVTVKVPGARLTEGIKVAILVAAAYETCPGTLAPREVKINVELLIVAGFIALLNVAVITVEANEATVEPSGGVTELTLGGVSGSPGFPAFAFLSKSAHPATKATNRSATNDIFPVLNLRIGFCSCSRLGSRFARSSLW